MSMIRGAFEPYEGREPYLFISYAHKDSDRVIPILDQLHDRGYRIWYDDGIAPGSEWPEYIATHLEGSATVIAFVSANSLASPNCRREITFALAKRKNFLSILLEECEMSPGMEMQLSAQQSILYHNYKTGEQFMKKLCGTDIVNVCKAEVTVPEDKPKVQNAAAFAEETRTAEPVRTDAASADEKAEQTKPGEITAQDMAAVEELKRLATIQKDPKIHRAAEKKPVKKTEKKSGFARKLKLILAGIGGAILLLIVGGVVAVKSSQVTIAEGLVVDKGVQTLHLNSQEITPEMMKKINKLKSMTGIVIQNSDLSGVSLADLSRLSVLKNITINDCTGVDWSFLQGEFAELNQLCAENSGLADSDLNLAGMPKLNTLDLSGNAGISTLEGLAVDDLRNLDIGDTSVSDISMLADALKLSEICTENTAVTNIDMLMGLESLTVLDVSGCAIETITGNCQSLRITELDLGNTKITDISAFANLTLLQILDLTGLPVTEAECLTKSTSTIRELYLMDTALTAESMNTIASCLSLRTLDLTNVDLAALGWQDLSVLSSLSDLRVILAANTGLVSGKGLENKAELRTLILKENPLTEVADLTSAEKLDTVDIRNCQITDLTFLPTHKKGHLLVSGNPLNLVNDMNLGRMEASALVADYDEELVAVKVNCYLLFVLDTPDDHKVEVENAYGKNYVRFVDAATVDGYVETYGYDYHAWE